MMWGAMDMLSKTSLQGRVPTWPIHTQEEEEAVLRVVRSRRWWRGSGCEVDRFEEEFAAFIGVPHVRALTNGTHAIELALACAGVRFGDEVLVPASTFISTASAVLTYGAIPIPVDVTADTLCMDVSQVEQRITPRTRAIIPVHMAGYVCDMEPIQTLARRHHLTVIEDAAHAHGATRAGKNAGGIAELSIFSFQNGKLMTAGEGGALCAKDASAAGDTFMLHSCGRPKGDTDYDHRGIGSNFRMSELQAAVLRAQLKRLPEQLRVRTRNARLLSELLSQVPGVEPLAKLDERDTHSLYMYLFRFDPAQFGNKDAGALSAALREAGVMAYRCFPSVSRTQMFARKSLERRGLDRAHGGALPDYENMSMPNAEAAYHSVIWLHHSLLLATQDVLEDAAGVLQQLRGR
jgi:3-amino-5-hydroxybenzoate synthase